MKFRTRPWAAAGWAGVLCAASALALAGAGGGRAARESRAPEGRGQEVRYGREGRYYVREIAGSIPSAAPLVRVESDIGSVSVRGEAADEVSYRIRVRAPGGDDAAARSRVDDLVVSASRSGDVLLFRGQAARADAEEGLHVEFAIGVPSRTPAIEVTTGAGNVEATGLDGRATLSTRGGTIVARDIGGLLQAETRSGNIEVGRAGSGLSLATAGGGVVVESAGGDLVARTSGGDVRIGTVAGGARVETGGGSVRVESASGGVLVVTAGGNIVLGEIGGEVSAATGGGSIRVRSAGGGVRCQSAAGPIVLDGVDGPIRAVTSAGNIRADIAAPGAADTGSELDFQTYLGDIVLSLPEGLPLTVRALVDDAIGGRIRSEFPLRVTREAESAGGPSEMAEGDIGGGGPVLKIRARGGNIVILKAKAARP